MDVTPITPLNAPTPPAETGAGNNNIDQQEFLLLMVTQLQNQDPLDPLDSADFSAQLAQFSSLEQLVEINDNLSAPPVATAEEERAVAVAYLGREVTVPASTVEVADGGIGSIEVDVPVPGAIEIELLDSRGDVVLQGTTDSLGPGSQTVDLSALEGADGLSDGLYSLRTTLAGEAGGQPVPAHLRGVVSGVEFGGGTPQLLIGSIPVPMAEVSAVRVPSEPTT